MSQQNEYVGSIRCFWEYLYKFAVRFDLKTCRFAKTTKLLGAATCNFKTVFIHNDVRLLDDQLSIF